jgi:hypothetical protein
MQFEAAYPCYSLVTKGLALSKNVFLFARNVNMANQEVAEGFSQKIPGVDNTIEIVYSEIGKKRKQQEVP